MAATTGIINISPHAGVSHVKAIFAQVCPHLDEQGRSKEYKRFKLFTVLQDRLDRLAAIHLDRSRILAAQDRDDVAAIHNAMLKDFTWLDRCPQKWPISVCLRAILHNSAWNVTKSNKKVIALLNGKRPPKTTRRGPSCSSAILRSLRALEERNPSADNPAYSRHQSLGDVERRALSLSLSAVNFHEAIPHVPAESFGLNGRLEFKGRLDSILAAPLPPLTSHFFSFPALPIYAFYSQTLRSRFQAVYAHRYSTKRATASFTPTATAFASRRKNACRYPLVESLFPDHIAQSYIHDFHVTFHHGHREDHYQVYLKRGVTLAANRCALDVKGDIVFMRVSSDNPHCVINMRRTAKANAPRDKIIVDYLFVRTRYLPANGAVLRRALVFY
ncbi:hypothetical protein C8R45DRAFT_936034 [Mycena sanguinolenta]|nr:hypothetical protein C8R45DRAFT_936034 [Mycena sanguinolenta]